VDSRPARTGLRDLFLLAEEHGGLFAARQARRVGVSDRMLTYYVKRGDLERGCPCQVCLPPDTPSSSGAALPVAWREDLRGFLADYPLQGVAGDADQLVERFASFWDPLLTGGASGRWDPNRWRWGA